MHEPTTGAGTPPGLPPPPPPAAPPPPAPAPTAPVPTNPVPTAPAPLAPRSAAPPAAGQAGPGGPGGPSSTGAGPTAHARGDGEGHRGVALLLGAVAIIAALVGARSTALSNDASDLWQSSLRTEVKRSTGALEDIRYVYGSELPVAVVVMSSRLQADEMRTAAAAVTGEAAARLALEAEVASGVATAIEGSAPLVTDPAYALPGGGVDLGQRLADQRNENADLVALDPDAIATEGDHLSTKSSSMTLALLPLGFAALFGAMAQPFWRRRRLLLAAGTAALGLGAAIALMVEVLG